MGKKRPEGQPAFDPNQDRYTDPATAVLEVVQDEDFPKGRVELIEIHFAASGEYTWRAWEPRADESVGGYHAAPSAG